VPDLGTTRRRRIVTRRFQETNVGVPRRPVRLTRAVTFVWQSGRRWTLANAALIAVQGLLPLVGLYLTKLIVDAVAAGMEASDRQATLAHVGGLVLLAGVVALASAVCQALAGLVREAQGLAVTDHMHGLLQAKSAEVDLEYYENSRYYDTLHRAQQEAPYRPPRIVNGLIQVGQNAVSLAAMAGLLFSFHWGVALVLFVAVAPGILVRIRYAGLMFQWQQERTPAERRAWYFNYLLTAEGHAKELRLFGLAPLFMDRFRDLRRQLRRERLKIATRRSITELAMQVGMVAAVFGSYAFIAVRTIQGRITLGDLVMYFQAFQRGQTYLREVLGGLAGLYEDHLFLSNLYEFLDLKRAVVDPPRPAPVPDPMREGIEFRGVTFRYPGSALPAVEDIDLTIRPGEIVALVGENGAGKTTLVKLLCRLYDPTGGAIAIDGIDLRQFEALAWRRTVSVVLQDYARYQATARENIWFGNPGPAPDQGRIESAARAADAHDMILGLPRGYDTQLGKWFGAGEELSIGQWQKIALARAFLRPAQIVILDEPTSALDARAEFAVFERFRDLVRGRAAILVSHRFSTVRMADCIYVLGGGRIIERGAHDDLMRRGGAYARMFELQAQYYR
jgi:ATP-binding cassette subfamily B protein